MNLLGGVWIRFFLGWPIQTLFVVFPLGGYILCTYLLFLTLTIFWEQLCWGRKQPESRWETLCDTMCMAAMYVGIGIGFVLTDYNK